MPYGRRLMSYAWAPFLAACLLETMPARAAEVACAPLAGITAALASKWHEQPIAHAVAEAGVMLIVYAAPDGATWTLVGVRAMSPTIGCLLGSGTDWQVLAQVQPGKPI